MKKLMIAAAIVCAAVVAEAGTFQWNTSGVVYMPWGITAIQEGQFNAATSGANSKKMSGWASQATFTAVIALTVGTASENTSVTSISYSNGAIQTTGLQNSLFELPESGSKDLYYSIVINGTYNDGSDNWTITSSTISGKQTLTDQSMMKLTTGVPTSWTFAKSGPEPEPTPEPTSAMLMLLGVAGLALKRKRA